MPVEAGAIEAVCRECGQLFAITAWQQQWFAEQAAREPGQWSLPKRCFTCRRRRRDREQGIGWTSDSSD